MVELAQAQAVQVQAIDCVSGERDVLLPGLVQSKFHIALAQLGQSDVAALLGVVDGVPPRTAADVQHGLTGTDILVHHIGGQQEFKRVITPQPVPLQRRVGIIVGADNVNVLIIHGNTSIYIILDVAHRVTGAAVVILSSYRNCVMPSLS